MKIGLIAAAIFLAEFTCPLGGGGGTAGGDDPTAEQCDRQEGVCLNRCIRSTPDGMENPTSASMQECYAECMADWADNCDALEAVVAEQE